MNYSFFIGIDISKKTLDFAVRDRQQHLFHRKVDNSALGLKEFKKECLFNNIDLQDSLICCEHTGVYSQHILALAMREEVSVWIESSLRIKRSVGIQRGKNDRIDAMARPPSELVSMLFAMPIKPLFGSQKDKLSASYAN